jgi:hypothetical protein
MKSVDSQPPAPQPPAVQPTVGDVMQRYLDQHVHRTGRAGVDFDGYKRITQVSGKGWSSPILLMLVPALLAAGANLHAQEVLGEHPDHQLLQAVAAPEPLVSTRATQSDLVRVVYLIPSNRAPQPDAEKLIQRFLLRLRSLFDENLSRLGYTGRAIALETSGGVPTVHFAHVPEPDTAFHDLNYGARWSKILAAVQRAGYPPFMAGQALLVIAETHRMMADGTIDPATNFVGGTGTTDGRAGAAVATGDFFARSRAEFLLDDRPYGGITIPALGPFPLVQNVSFAWFEGSTISSTSSSAEGAIAHELAHAFALPHDFRNDENFNGDLLGNGLRGLRGFFHPDRYPQDDVRFSSGTARLLISSRFFAGTRGTDVTPPSVQILTHGTIVPSHGQLRIEALATDDTLMDTLVLLRNGNAVADAHVDWRDGVATLETYDYSPGVTDEWQVIAVDVSGNRALSSQVPLTAAPGNRAPVPNIRATKRRVTVGEAVLLDATRAIDPDGSSSALQVEWDVDGDGYFDTPRSTSKILSTVYTRPGTYQVIARFWDEVDGVSISVPIGIRVIPSLVNHLVSFEPHTGPVFTPDATGCPAQYAGKFSFDAVLSNIGAQTLRWPFVEIVRLTQGNLLREGDQLLEETQLFTPALPGPTLVPGESVTLPFTVCLEQQKPFQLLVNVRATPD